MQKVPRIAQSWWHTKKGRDTAAYIVTGVAGLSSVFHFFPNTLLKDRFVKQVCIYKEAQPVPVSEDIERRLKESLELTQSVSAAQKLTKAFTVFGFELFSIGSTMSRQGLDIGIPINYNYLSTDDIDKTSLQIDNEPVDWGTDAAEQLAASLVVPEKLQIFGICREIINNSNYNLIISTVYACVPFFFGYTVSSKANDRFGLLAKPRGVRFTIYGLAGLMSYGIYCLFTDFTRNHFETMTDEQLCELGPDFAERGVQFYDKILQRNMALRTLMGESGAKKFSRKGDENHLFRRPNIPLTERKKFFESKMNEKTKSFVEETAPIPNVA